MKVIIAGGRKFILRPHHYQWLDALHLQHKFTEVISGGASGVDTCGEIWARLNEIPVKRFPANWDELGSTAGPIRNAKMARYVAESLGGGICVLFPGGRGTDNMRKTAKRFHIETIEYRSAA